MLALALTIAMLFLYRMFFVHEPPPETQTTEQTAAVTHPAPSAASPATSAKSAPAAAAAVPAALPVTQGATVQDIVIENNHYRVTFSTVGAVAHSWMLKGYPKGENVETINADAAKALGYPLSIGLADSTQSAQLNQVVYAVKAYDGKPVAKGETPAELTGTSFAPPVKLEFTYSDGKVQVKKKFSFTENYAVHSSVSVSDGQHNLPVEVQWPGGFGDQSIPAANEAIVARAAYETVDEGKVREVTLMPSFLGRFFSSGSPSAPQQDIPGPLVFAGLEDQFFASILLPDSPEASAQIKREVWTPDHWQGEDKDKPRPLLVSLSSTSSKPLDFRLFVAPKDLDVLRAMHPPLDNLVDFGWFSVVAKPLFICLHYVNDHWAHNYGWAIVLLTVIITSLMFPLKLKSLRSAQEMQKVAPIIKSIQDKYKNYKFNDPRKQKANEEIMKVYSEHGINPLAGCLPMALQLPVLYAFYRVLSNVIELRHAPWILWVKDLSAPDRLIVMGHSIPILVILMTAASYFSTRMTPTPTADPAQARMMMFMPIFMGFIFLRLASGVVLYYFVSSVIQMLQQVILNRWMPRPGTPPPPAPRKQALAKG